MLEAGFASIDITPRTGVELCGFGAFINRHAIGVRDRLMARAVAFRHQDRRQVILSCDLVGVQLDLTRQVRRLVSERTGLPPEALLISCSHTHSGPCTVPDLIGWGDVDAPYLEFLPNRLAAAAEQALADLAPARLAHAEAPCEGLALNREYDRDAPPLDEVLNPEWRPAKPELTDTTCHVIRIDREDGKSGLLAYFSCHPVVCCAETRYIHGDFCGVAMGNLERSTPGLTALFLQGAQGDVNSCVVHKPETESLLALNVLAGRFEAAVREGLEAAQPIATTPLGAVIRRFRFSRKCWSRAELLERLSDHQAVLHQADADASDRKTRLAVVHVLAYRKLLARLDQGDELEPETELQAMRLGPLALLACPFEIFQAIKRDILARTTSDIALVMGVANDLLGYTPDRTVAARGGYATDTVPAMLGQLPFAAIHDELVEAMLALEADLGEQS